MYALVNASPSSPPRFAAATRIWTHILRFRSATLSKLLQNRSIFRRALAIATLCSRCCAIQKASCRFVSFPSSFWFSSRSCRSKAVKASSSPDFPDVIISRCPTTAPKNVGPSIVSSSGFRSGPDSRQSSFIITQTQSGRSSPRGSSLSAGDSASSNFRIQERTQRGHFLGSTCRTDVSRLRLALRFFGT